MVTGYLTVTDMVKWKLLSDKNLLDSSRILDLITQDLSSEKKLHIQEGVNYYASKHDILENVNYYWVDGVQNQDITKSNYRIPHPFHKMLVDQKASYVAGNPIVVSIAKGDVVNPKKLTPAEQAAKNAAEEYQKTLVEHLTNKFDDLMNDWIIGAANKGEEWIHFYIAPDGSLKFIICPAEQIIPVYDTQYQEDLMYVIRFYEYELIDETGKHQTRYKVEWWSKEEVEYWVQLVDNSFIHDPAYEVNPGPHWFEVNTATPGVREALSWGRVPFVVLLNNSEGTTDLQPIKALIDAYDKVKSGWINDLADFQ